MLNQIKSKVLSILANDKVRNGLVVAAVVIAAVGMSAVAFKVAEYEADRTIDRLMKINP